MNGSRTVSLAPRDVEARASVSCSATDLEARITYASAPGNASSPIQRQIEAALLLPSPAWRIMIAGLELGFEDGARLSDVSLYANFAGLDSTAIVLPLESPSPVWLGFPGLDLAQDDVFSVDAPLSLSLDRPHGLVLAQFGIPVDWFSTAEGLLVGVDVAGLAAGFLFQNVRWTR